MKSVNVIIARIYILEAEHALNAIVKYLRHEAHIRGVTVFRAISGFGESGDQVSSLMDISLNLPLVIEFFDSEDRVMPALAHIAQSVKSEHIVYWQASANE